MELIRSWLFVPGHQQRMIDRALGLDADAVVLDLEDGVPLNSKQTARDLVRAAAQAGQRAVLFVRIQGAFHQDLTLDVAASVVPGVDGIVLPKVRSAEDVVRCEHLLRSQEAAVGLPRGSIRLVALIESARGLLQAPAIASSSARLVGLMFGAEDFAVDLGQWSHDASVLPEHLYARSALVVAAASEGLQAIDRVCTILGQPELLSTDAEVARGLGFSGKALIHPEQIAVVHRLFTPSRDEMRFAQRVLDGYERAAQTARGAVLVDGRLVDPPVAERARRLLAAWQRWQSGRAGPECE